MLLEVTSVVLLITVLFLFLRRKLAYRFLNSHSGIKGPPPTLFLGNYLQIRELGMPGFMDVNVKKYGDVFGFYIGILPAITVKDLDMLKQIMVKQFDDFMDRPHGFVIMQSRGRAIDNVLTGRGESWRRQRRIISRSFTTVKLNKMAPIIESSCVSLASKLGDHASSGESFDIWKLYGSYTMEVILATGFGHKLDVINGQSDDLVNAAQYFVKSNIGANFPFLKGVFSKLAMKSQRAKAFFHVEEKAMELIHDRIQRTDGSEKYQDLLQLLIDSKDDEEGDDGVGGAGAMGGAESRTTRKGKLTEFEIVNNSVIFLMAGQETTNNTLGYTSYLLALHPEEQDKVCKEIDEFYSNNPDASLLEASQNLKYLDMVIQESLRVYPSTPVISRHIMRDTEINGVKFPKGGRLTIPIRSIHYSPDIWPEPNEFRPERFTKEEKEKRHQMAHMPFGWGPRLCLGMRLAMMEAKMALIAILREYQFIEAPDTEKPLKLTHLVTMAPANGIYLIIKKRKTEQ